MTETEKQIKEMHGMMCVIVSDTKAMKKTLYGNGQPGVTDRLTIQEQKMEAIEDMKEEISGISTKVNEVATKQATCKGSQMGKKQQVVVALSIVSCGIAFFSMLISYLKLSAL